MNEYDVLVLIRSVLHHLGGKGHDRIAIENAIDRTWRESEMCRQVREKDIAETGAQNDEPAADAADTARIAELEFGLTEARKTLSYTIEVIKGREHTGFIDRAIARIDATLAKRAGE